MFPGLCLVLRIEWALTSRSAQSGGFLWASTRTRRHLPGGRILEVLGWPSCTNRRTCPPRPGPGCRHSWRSLEAQIRELKPQGASRNNGWDCERADILQEGVNLGLWCLRGHIITQEPEKQWLGDKGAEWGATCSGRNGLCPRQGRPTDPDSLGTYSHAHHSFCTCVIKTHSHAHWASHGALSGHAPHGPFTPQRILFANIPPLLPFPSL